MRGGCPEAKDISAPLEQDEGAQSRRGVGTDETSQFEFRYDVAASS